MTEAKRLKETGVASEDPNAPGTRWVASCLDMVERLDSATTEQEVTLVASEWTIHLATRPDSWDK